MGPSFLCWTWKNARSWTTTYAGRAVPYTWHGINLFPPLFTSTLDLYKYLSRVAVFRFQIHIYTYWTGKYSCWPLKFWVSTTSPTEMKRYLRVRTYLVPGTGSTYQVRSSIYVWYENRWIPDVTGEISSHDSGKPRTRSNHRCRDEAWSVLGCCGLWRLCRSIRPARARCLYKGS